MNRPRSFFVADKTISLLFSALLSAIFISISMPGFPGLWPFLFISLVPLIQFSLYAKPFRAFIAGLVSGFLYHLFLLYWIVITLGRYGGLSLWLSITALLLLSLFLGFYIGGSCCLISWFAGRYRQKEKSCIVMVLTAPFVWVGFEWLKGSLFTGFPWMDLAYGLYEQTRLIQAADLGGHYLLTFSIVLVNSLIVYMFDVYRSRVHWNRRRDKLLVILSCAFILIVIGYSQLRYKQIGLLVQNNLKTKISIAQGNIEQNEKWSEKNKIKTVNIYRKLSIKALDNNPSELVVWPETAIPFFANRDPLFSRVKDLTKKHNIYLLTGAPFYTRKIDKKGEAVVEYFNSALLIGPDGRLKGRYNKIHLVPFGEYVPLREFLFFLSPVVETVADFTPGSSRKPLMFGPLKLGVLICFESIFPDLAADLVDSGANILVNLTNDAWYGRSSAPYQTLAMAVFRTIETRRSLIRAANSGISCFIDPAGNILKRSEIFVETYMSAEIPINIQKNIFLVFGRYFGAACFSLIIAMLFFKILKRN